MGDDASTSSNLDKREQRLAERFMPLRATGIHEILRAEGESELTRTLSALLWSGLTAGLSMGFSFTGQALLQSGLPDMPYAHLIASAGYTLGFIVIVLGRQQLFTESTLTAVLPALTKRDLPSLGSMGRLWAAVLVANIIGTWVFAAALVFGHPFRPEVMASLGKLADDAYQPDFWGAALKGIFAGWLIALMVWLLPSARSASLFVIMLLTYLVALARLPHIVAGSSDAAFAVLAGTRSLSAYWTSFFLPTLIGNTIGGVCLTAMLNHAPVAPELDTG